MTIITDMKTKHPPDPPSRYQLLWEAYESEDPSFGLKNLKESIRNSPQQDEGEVTISQIREHFEMKDFFDFEKRWVERDLYYYISDEGFSFKIKLAILYAFIIIGTISCHLVYNLYLGQELSLTTRLLSIDALFILPMIVIMYWSIPGGSRGDRRNPPYNEDYNSMNVSEMKQRQLELIDCYLNQVLPMKAEIPALRYRHDVLAMGSVGEWMFYFLFRVCYSICRLLNNWSNEEIRGIETMDILISSTAISAISGVFIYFWHSSKLAKYDKK